MRNGQGFRRHEKVVLEQPEIIVVIDQFRVLREEGADALKLPAAGVMGVFDAGAGPILVLERADGDVRIGVAAFGERAVQRLAAGANDDEGFDRIRHLVPRVWFLPESRTFGNHASGRDGGYKTSIQGVFRALFLWRMKFATLLILCAFTPLVPLGRVPGDLTRCCCWGRPGAASPIFCSG